MEDLEGVMVEAVDVVFVGPVIAGFVEQLCQSGQSRLDVLEQLPDLRAFVLTLRP